MSAEAQKKWREAHPEVYKQKNRDAANKWRKAHPERVKANRNSPKGRWQFFKCKTTKRGITYDEVLYIMPILIAYREHRRE